ncbi:PREDICTED: receptor-transporting protein 2-like [Gekko japonicus]|uniref:Receptor-transporting protein 2-like n=1 Tax=Gekko japonicus TaxID=146911 RepID=A0ABM1L472_GEKJA|nr:PREDICTED: receptor-transporting protein 2-like [Gekko japonicus]
MNMEKLKMDDWRRIFQGQIRVVKPNHSWSLKRDQQLVFNGVESGWIQVLQEHAHASFTCSQCHHWWSSHQVVILFRMRWDQLQCHGCVWMKVFRQQCDNCFPNKYEEPQFTEMDVGNVIRHLILDIREKCYRERVDRSELLEVVLGHTGPHRPRHCEACKLGIHKWHHRGSKGILGRPIAKFTNGIIGVLKHDGKAQSLGHSRNTEETKTRAQPSIDSTQPSSPCVDCLWISVIFILMITAYLIWQNSG